MASAGQGRGSRMFMSLVKVRPDAGVDGPLESG